MTVNKQLLGSLRRHIQQSVKWGIKWRVPCFPELRQELSSELEGALEYSGIWLPEEVDLFVGKKKYRMEGCELIGNGELIGLEKLVVNWIKYLLEFLCHYNPARLWAVWMDWHWCHETSYAVILDYHSIQNTSSRKISPYMTLVRADPGLERLGICRKTGW